jgi:hypothetical protein
VKNKEGFDALKFGKKQGGYNRGFIGSPSLYRGGGRGGY